MKKNIRSGLFFFGMALVAATTIRAMADMLQAEKFNPWSAVLAAGLIFMSIGVRHSRK